MPSLSGGVGGASINGSAARDKAWIEYVNTLEDALTEPKEFVASMTLSQDTLMKKMREERKQMKLMMAQNTKLMPMLETNISRKGEESGRKSLGNGKVRNAEAHLQAL